MQMLQLRTTDEKPVTVEVRSGYITIWVGGYGPTALPVRLSTAASFELLAAMKTEMNPSAK